MRTDAQRKAEIEAARVKLGLPLLGAMWEHGYCHTQRDGDCNAAECPQNRDGEPRATGRHCPLDLHDEERGYQ